MNKKGVFDAYIIFTLAAVFTIFLAVFLVGFLIRLNSATYVASSQLISQANASITEKIQDSAVKTSVTNAMSSAVNSQSDNIINLSWLFQYSWIFILVILAIIMFMYARQRVETQQNYGRIF